MKIKEVLLKEMGSRGAVPKKDQAAQPSQSFPIDDGGYDAMGNVTTGMPSASPTAVAAPAPAQAGQAKWPTTKAEIISLNGLVLNPVVDLIVLPCIGSQDQITFLFDFFTA